MVRVKESDYYEDDGNINIDAWLNKIFESHSDNGAHLIRQACRLSQLAGAQAPTPSGKSCLQQGLAMAEILLDCQPDPQCIAAAILYHSVRYAELSLDIIQEQFNSDMANLIKGVKRMQAISTLQSASYGHNHHENVRMMLLAMVEDVRVVLIKLTEQVVNIRNAALFSREHQIAIAKETLDIYAPLANRLGVYQIKWELEDLAFRYIDPETYKSIAKLLDQRRLDREQYVKSIVSHLKNALTGHNIANYEVYGRAKHIYSIFRKMHRKKINYEKIYDTTAVRVLVPTVEDAYTVLSIVHNLWEQIPEEFDDYISAPKANGYRSIHTAVHGPDNKNIEVQIRTFSMHQECEIGVAAHWIYKEGKQQKPGYEAKISWLRQVLEWQKELIAPETVLEENHSEIFDDRVYVFTPKGHVVDLKNGATPLDFAYHIHTDIGHRCRGAKINGHIVPLTYRLKTADRVEILTAKQPHPSRDWLNSHLGYLNTPRAKAKVQHWFKQQDYHSNLQTGQELFESECQRLGITEFNLSQISEKYNFKSSDDLLAALGCGDIRLAQILNAWRSINQQSHPSTALIPPVRKPTATKTKSLSSEINIYGVDNLLSHYAKCCKPIPGDSIVGFITTGKGISIHRADCNNILNANAQQQQRIIEVEWGSTASQVYQIDLLVNAYDRPGLLRDITNMLANERTNLLALNTNTDKNENIAYLKITLEIEDLEMLSRLTDRLLQIKNVYEVKRPM